MIKMSFFRRLFTNSSDEPKSDATPPQIEKAAEPVNTVKSSDPLATGELSPPEGMIMDDDIVIAKLDETMPVPDDLDDPTVPDRVPDLGDTKPSPNVVPLGITRPLPDADQLVTTVSGHIVFGLASDQGMVRLNNQDSAFAFFFTSKSVDEYPDFGVFVVADGMGGHSEGEKASAISARIVATEIMQRVYLPLLQGKETGDVGQPTIVESLVEAVQKANIMVREKVADGGTTLTAAVVRGEAAHIAHVGDSRAYWIENQKEIVQITRDHSVVQRLIELDQLTPEEAEHHEQRNVLYRAIGQNDEVEVEIHRKRLVSNSHLMICSDGLWNMVPNEEILEVIKTTPDPQEACDKLIALANTHGGSDNISVILVKTSSK
jgi:serine/threonine protein phosphatase PrpC